MTLKPVDALTAQQMHQRAADFAAQLGGDAIASRASKPLCRIGISSIGELRTLRKALGEREFHIRLLDLRNFGALCLERVMAKMDDPEAEKVAAIADMPPFAELPDGFAWRLRELINANHSLPDSVILTVNGETGTRFGLNHGDLKALHIMLVGELT